MVSDLNTSEQTAIFLNATYSSAMLVHCYQITWCHISENSNFLYHYILTKTVNINKFNLLELMKSVVLDSYEWKFSLFIF
jgi:hypothetical protein